MMSLDSNTLLAFASGCCAALASLFGKMTFSNDLAKWICEQNIIMDNINRFGEWNCTIISYPVRAIFLALLVLSNTVMWTIFAKAMSNSKSTIEVTVVNTASNFMCSALFGWLLFDETFSLRWSIGLALVIIGLAIMHSSSSSSSSSAQPTQSSLKEEKVD